MSLPKCKGWIGPNLRGKVEEDTSQQEWNCFAPGQICNVCQLMGGMRPFLKLLHL